MEQSRAEGRRRNKRRTDEKTQSANTRRHPNDGDEALPNGPHQSKLMSATAPALQTIGIPTSSASTAFSCSRTRATKWGRAGFIQLHLLPPHDLEHVSLCACLCVCRVPCTECVSIHRITEKCGKSAVQSCNMADVLELGKV